MSSRASSVATPTDGTAERCITESAHPEEPEPMPAKKRKAEMEEKLRKIRERQALYCEVPNDDFVAKMAQLFRGRPAYPSWDENARKRRRTRHISREKKSKRNTYSKKIRSREKAPPPPGALVTASTDSHAHVPALGPLVGLPAEIRDEILRYILLWPEDIMLFCGWTRVFPRSRPRLDLSILYTCRLLRDQGLRILYGENQFAYHSRDPKVANSHSAPVLSKVFTDGAVPINKCGHLMRYIVLKVDASRICFYKDRHNLEKAILKFLPFGGIAQLPNIHTVTLDIPIHGSPDQYPEPSEARSSIDPDGLGSSESCEEIISRCLQRGSTIYEALLKIRAQWVRVLARDYRGLCWETKIDMRYYAKDEHMRFEHMASLRRDEKMGRVMPKDAHNTVGSITDYRTKDVPAMEKYWDREVRAAVARLGNLSKHIEALATERRIPASECKYWKLVHGAQSGANRLRDRAELTRKRFRI